VVKKTESGVPEDVIVQEPAPVKRKLPLMGTKASFRNFKEFLAHKDVLEVVLKPDKLYDIEEVRRLIGEFLERKVT